jgi:single-strand DNA-binding protein
MYQKLTLIGNLGKDPEMRYLPDGTPVASFSLAVNKSWTKDGQKQDETTWFNCSCWRKQAEVVTQYLKKGNRALIVGEVKARAYTAKDGTAAASLDVNVQEVKFLTSKNEADESSTNGTSQQAPAPVAATDDQVPW